MTIQLHVRPTVSSITRVEFERLGSPRFSIALDGYVRGAPWFDAAGPRANFNHHEDVDRLSTRSTCAQVLMAIRMGLYDRFRDEHGIRADVFVNDCDEDVCTSWALLERPDLCEDPTNPVLNRLVALEDGLDCTAGMYPLHKDAFALRELAWIFEPYRLCRVSGRIDKRDAVEFRSVIQDVVGRIRQHLVGRGQNLPIDVRYERLHVGTGWTAVREVGAQARTGMFSDGVRAFVSVRERGDGRYTYSIGRASTFVGPCFRALCAELDAAERIYGAMTPEDDGWGGGDTIFGSPRVHGSSLKPEKVFSVVERAFGGA